MEEAFQLAAFRYHANRLENRAIALFAGTPGRYDEIIQAFMMAMQALERIQDDIGIAPIRCPDDYVACPGGLCVPPGEKCIRPPKEVGDPPGGGGCPDPDEKA